MNARVAMCFEIANRDGTFDVQWVHANGKVGKFVSLSRGEATRVEIDAQRFGAGNVICKAAA